MDLMAVLAALGPVDHRVPSASGSFEPIGVIVHHTASGMDGGPLASLTTCREGRPKTKKHKKLPGPLCNVLIGRDASVNVIADGKANDSGTGDPHVFKAFSAHQVLPKPDDDDPVKKPNGHFMSGNKFFFDVEVENTGLGNEPYPAAQVEMTARVVAAICRAHGFAADRVLCHKEWTRRKIDWSNMSGDETRALVARFMEEDVFMALSDGEQRELLDRVRALHIGNWVGDGSVKDQGDLAWLDAKVRAIVHDEQAETADRVRALHTGNWVGGGSVADQGDLAWLDTKVRQIVREELAAAMAALAGPSD